VLLIYKLYLAFYPDKIEHCDLIFRHKLSGYRATDETLKFLFAHCHIVLDLHKALGVAATLGLNRNNIMHASAV